MKRYSVALFLGLFFLKASAQYYAIPIQHDTAIQWAAECDKVVNLTSVTGGNSLKAWYLDKLKKSTVTAYTKERGSKYGSSYDLSLPSLERQDWLKGLTVEVSPVLFREWYFVDTNIHNYDRFKYRGGTLLSAADSCCGCDEADAFLAKQVLNYKNGKFSIWNVFISPLCARQTNSPPFFSWYPLVNVAYNDNVDRKLPAPGKDVVLLNTTNVDYDFNFETPSAYDTLLSVSGTDIGSLIYQDILKGNLRPVDPETGQPILVKEFLTRGMPADTVLALDPDQPDKVLAYKVLQSERSSRSLNRIRIKQDLYFDFKNERLYSVVRSVTLMIAVMGIDGKTIRGQYAFCRLE